MASSSRTRAAVIAGSLLIAAPSAAQTPAAPAAAPPAAPAQPPAPPPPPPRPMSQQPMNLQSAGRAAPPQRAPRRGAPAWNKGKRGRVAAAFDGLPLASAPSFLRLDDGVTRVELEVSARVDVAENKAQGRIVYRLRGAQVGERTNQLPLPTGFFSTPVDRMQLIQQGPDVDLVIDLREASEPVQRVVETPRGIVLQVDFPKSVGFDRRHDQPPAPDTTSRERARRRSSTQTLGGSGSNGQPPEDDGN
jgi:hypothetical protein